MYGLCSRYVLLVSGLGIGSSWSDQLSIEMLVDYITGQLGGVSVSFTFIFTLLFSFVCLGSEVLLWNSESHNSR